MTNNGIKKQPFIFLVLIGGCAFFVYSRLVAYHLFPEDDGVQYLWRARLLMHGNTHALGTYWSPVWIALIALQGYFVNNLEAGARLLNAFLSALLPLFSYKLAAEVFDKKVGYVAAMLVLANYSVIRFATMLYPEPLYAVLWLVIALVGLRALTVRKNHLFFIWGTLIGVNYMLRNEALFFALPFLFIIILKGKRAAFKQALFFIGGIALIITMLGIFYYSLYGRITIGTRFEHNYLLSTSSAGTTQVSEAAKTLSLPLAVHIDRGGITLLQKTGYNAYILFHALMRSCSPVPWVGWLLSGFFTIGLFGCLTGDKRKRAVCVYLFLYPAMVCGALLVFWVYDQFIMPFMPFLLIISAAGIVVCGRFLKSRRIVLVTKSAAVFLYVLILVTNLNVATHPFTYEGENGLLMKMAGTWVRDAGGMGTACIASNALTQYYFSTGEPDDWDSSDIFENIQKLTDYMKEKNITYLIVGNWEEEPAMRYFFTHDPVNGFVLCKDITGWMSNGTNEIRIYKRVKVP